MILACETPLTRHQGAEAVKTTHPAQTGTEICAIHCIALLEQKLREIGAALAGDAADDGSAHICLSQTVEIKIADSRWDLLL